ncbi:MAG: hypothetical protein PHP42_04300 [Bacteroidota bacterium]|nr:hypothetical protein [Bacteroidota bacterium]
MKENKHHTPDEHGSHIRITGLNKDKTRKASRSETMYQVYFELSEYPSLVWKKIFEQEWKTASAVFAAKNKSNKAAIDQGFLAIHCPLTEVETMYLPALKKAVTAANTNYEHYELLQTQVHTQKENVWKEERKIVDEMEKTLTFE